MRVHIRPQWSISPGGAGNGEDLAGLDIASLLALLAAVQETGAIAQAARSLGVSYRHAWGQVKAAEALFGHALIDAGRGRGSTLSPLAEKLIWAQRRVQARLTPLLDSLASELETEIERSLPRAPQPLRLHASHGFAVAALVEQLEAVPQSVELRYRHSVEAVAALSRGECDLAGFHLPIGEFEARAAQRYRVWLRDEEHRLVHLAVRWQGLFVAPGNPKRVRGVDDLAREDLRFVNRPQGSGTRMLTELLLDKHGLSPAALRGWESTEFTHAAVAAYIASGMADVGLGVQTAAQRFGLTFLPLLRERYFFAVRAEALERPAMKSLLALLGSPAYRATVAAMAGYEAAETGRVLSVAEAFGKP